jgi:hypothetical protein
MFIKYLFFIGGAFTAPFELYFKSDLSSPRLGAAPVSCVYQSPCFGAGLLWRSLGRSLLANAMRARLVYGWRLGGGSRQPSRPHFNSFTIRKEQYLISGFVRFPLSTL